MEDCVIADEGHHAIDPTLVHTVRLMYDSDYAAAWNELAQRSAQYEAERRWQEKELCILFTLPESYHTPNTISDTQRT